MNNSDETFYCSRCGCEFVPRPLAAFLINPNLPAYCRQCRREESEKFVSAIAGHLDARAAERNETVSLQILKSRSVDKMRRKRIKRKTTPGGIRWLLRALIEKLDDDSA